MSLAEVHATEEAIPGWKWDRRVTPSENRIATRYDTYLGGHAYGLRDGTALLDWQSGTLSGCGLHDLIFYQKNDRKQWVPRVETGEYSTYWDTRPLFSDRSTSVNLSTDITYDDRYIYTLADEELDEALLGSAFHLEAPIRFYDHDCN
jgi:hypothetical protein